jgi:carboxypeptidase family protein
MHVQPRRSSTVALVLTVALALEPCVITSASAGAPGRIEGLVVGLDGRAAASYRVHLIEPSGAEAASAVTDTKGLYSVPSIAAGEYGLALESADGRVAPVSRPVRIAAGQLARYDVRLLQAEPEEAEEAAEAGGGLGAWWAGLSTAAKVWIIVGSVAVVGVTYVAVTDDDNNEQEASPSGATYGLR